MSYYTYTKKELSQSGIQEGELAIYIGRKNPRQANSLSSDAKSRGAQNAAVYLWQNSQPQELDNCFQCDKAGLDVLEVQVGEEEYAFLRDAPSGYIRQISGPAKPIIVANLGGPPLRVDTFLGKFTVYGGNILRLNESTPRRGKKKVWLVLSSRYEQPLECAELCDGTVWRRLDICEENLSSEAEYSLTIRDGSAIVQHMTVNDKREILMMDPPEPNPDYEVYVSTKIGDLATLRFNRSDYRDGQVVQRVRTIPHAREGDPVTYDLQKLRESPTQGAVSQCAFELLKWREASISEKRPYPLYSDKLKAFLEGKNKPDGTVLGASEPDTESGYEKCEPTNGLSCLAALARACQKAKGLLGPEPPEDFPE